MSRPAQDTRILRVHPTVVRMASAHMMVDGYGNIYAPLLPLLIPKLQLSLMTAGAFAMLFQLAASVMQIVFGHLADRWRPRMLVVVGPFVAVAILSFVGVAHSKAVLAAILVVGGLGTAAFHPSAAALAHRLSGDAAGLAMSVYITGGSIGISFGPLIFAPFVQHVGLEWTPLLSLPGLAVVAAFAARVPRYDPDAAQKHQSGLGALKPYARPLALLYTIVVLRTLTSLSIATFVPVMLTRRGLSVGAAGMVVAIYLFASGVGGFLGGPLADRFGPRRVIVLSLVLSTPFLIVAPMLQGGLFVVALAAGGFFLQSTLPVNVTFGQALAPVSTATVSSLMMGFAWGTGGLSVPFVGMFADRFGIERTLVALSLVPLLAAACALPLPANAPVKTPPVPGPIDADLYSR
jgi:FSR family fosmidomycin resistance protein-like MFS transporter